MKDLDHQAMSKIVKESGIDAKKIEKIIGTLKISLARQAARTGGKSITLNKNTLSEVEESLRIGADITPSEAKDILIKVEDAIKIQDDTKVRFLDEGTFEVEEDTLKYKLGK